MIRIIFTIKITFLFLLFQFTSLGTVAAQISSKEILETLDGRENWYGVYIGNQKAGYAYEIWKKSTFNGNPIIISDLKWVMKTGYFDFSYKENTSFSLEGDHNIVSQYVHETSTYYEDNKIVESEESETQVTIKDGKYHILLDENGEKSTKQISFFPIDLKKYHFEVFGISDDIIDELGNKEFVSGIDLENYMPEYSIIKEVTTKNILVNGELIPKTSMLSVSALRTELEVEALSEYKGIDMVRSEFLGNWTLILETKENATKLTKAIKFKDLAEIPIDQLIDFENLTELKLQIDGVGVENLPSNDRQTVSASKIDSVEVLLKKNYKISKSQEDDLDLYLKSTKDLPLDLPDLIKINPINDKDLSDNEKSKILNHFVYNFIEYTVSPEEPSLKKIIDLRKGDCSEYATLMVALSRLNGIPAREVFGYAYGDENDTPTFGGHAWVELYIDGAWREYDPTWDEIKLGAMHILANDFLIFGGSIKVLN